MRGGLLIELCSMQGFLFEFWSEVCIQWSRAPYLLYFYWKSCILPKNMSRHPSLLHPNTSRSKSKSESQKCCCCRFYIDINILYYHLQSTLNKCFSTYKCYGQQMQFSFVKKIWLPMLNVPFSLHSMVKRDSLAYYSFTKTSGLLMLIYD